jgi:hypothetical protein
VQQGLDKLSNTLQFGWEASQKQALLRAAPGFLLTDQQRQLPLQLC